jgi:LacI family transcriptional regulator
MGAYRAAAEQGLSIPGDLSIVGFDDQELIAGSLHPGLTTVALPHYEMGAWAANHLIDALEGKTGGDEPAAGTTTLECPLVVRESVAPPRQ